MFKSGCGLFFSEVYEEVNLNTPFFINGNKKFSSQVSPFSKEGDITVNWSLIKLFLFDAPPVGRELHLGADL